MKKMDIFFIYFLKKDSKKKRFGRNFIDFSSLYAPYMD